MKEVKRKVPTDTKIYTGLFVGFMDGEPDDLIRQIRAMRTTNLNGISLFDYAHLDKKYITSETVNIGITKYNIKLPY